MVAMCIGVLIGALAGLYVQVIILVLLTILALLGTAIIGMANGLPLQITLLHMACIWVGLQLAYLASAFLVSRSPSEVRSTERVNAPNNTYAANQNAVRESALSQVHEARKVVGLPTRRLRRHLEFKRS